MTEPFLFYVVAIFLAFLLALLGVIRPFRVKNSLIVPIFLGILGVMAVSVVGLLSHPLPVEFMVVKPDVQKAKVMGMDSKEGEHIMLLLFWDGLEYPRWFRFPWDDRMMEEIQKGVEDAREGKTQGFEMNEPFEDSLDRREHPWTHPIPVPDQMRPKPNEAPKVFEFHRDA